MSLANRATTAAEYYFLTQNGWYESNLEIMFPDVPDGLYGGNWCHREVKDHKGPDEALEITRQRRIEFEKEST